MEDPNGKLETFLARAVPLILDPSLIRELAKEFGFEAIPNESTDDGLIGFDVSQDGISLGWLDCWGPDGSGCVWVRSEIEDQLEAVLSRALS